MAAPALSLTSLAASLVRSNMAASPASLPTWAGSSSHSTFNGRRISHIPFATRVCCGHKPVKVLMMGKREQEMVEVRNMSDEVIKETVVELKGELFLLRMKQVSRQEIRNSEFNRMRKQIARMLTVRRERELEKGIKKRESRKLDKEWKRNIVVKPPKSLAALMAKQTEK